MSASESNPPVSDAVVARHVELFDKLPAPPTPTKLRSRSFLESIYEHAARELEAAMPEEVAETLGTALTSPEAVISGAAGSGGRGFGPMKALRETPAPGLLGTRVRAEVKAWRQDEVQRRSRMRLVRRATRIAGGLSAAAAAVFVSLTFAHWGEDTATSRSEVAIVRYSVDAPIATGLSLGSILRDVGQPVDAEDVHAAASGAGRFAGYSAGSQDTRAEYTRAGATDARRHR